MDNKRNFHLNSIRMIFCCLLFLHTRRQEARESRVIMEYPLQRHIKKILISSTPDFGEKPCESHTQHIAQHIILMFLTFGIFFLDFFCLYFFDSDILRFAPSVRSFDAGTIRSGTSYSWMWTWCGSRRYAREKHSNPQHFRVAYRMPRARFSLARSVACPFLCRSGSRTRI